MNDTQKFDRPLDEWVDEEREVERLAVEDDGNGKFKVKPIKIKVNVPTRYTRATFNSNICKSGKHIWVMPNKNKHVANCTNCPKFRNIRAAFEYIDQDNHIRDRDSKMLID